MNIRGRVAVGVAFGLLLTPLAGEAQPAAGQPADTRRPRDGIFDTGANDAAERGSLVLEASGYGGHDDDVIAQESTGNPQFGVPGEFVGARAALDYTRIGQRTSFALGADSTLRYLNIPQRDTVGDGMVRASLTAHVSRKWLIRTDGEVGYTSFYRFAPVAGLAIADASTAAGADLAIGRDPAFTTGTLASISRTLGRRSSLSFEYSGRSTSLTDSTQRFVDYGGGATYEHPIGRNLTLHTGYAYRIADYRLIGGAEQTVMHDIDAGVRYEGRPSFSRRTRLAFSTGSAVIRRAPGVVDSTYVQLIGTATAVHEIGRTWTVHAGYDRGAQFVHVIAGVFSAHSASLGAAGELGRRFNLSMDASYSTGLLTFQLFEDPLTTYHAEARLRTAVSQTVAFDLSYLYYRYAFDGQGQPAALNRNVRRNAVTAGFTVRLSTAAKRRQP